MPPRSMPTMPPAYHAQIEGPPLRVVPPLIDKLRPPVTGTLRTTDLVGHRRAGRLPGRDRSDAGVQSTPVSRHQSRPASRPSSRPTSRPASRPSSPPPPLRRASRVNIARRSGRPDHSDVDDLSDGGRYSSFDSAPVSSRAFEQSKHVLRRQRVDDHLTSPLDAEHASRDDYGNYEHASIHDHPSSIDSTTRRDHMLNADHHSRRPYYNDIHPPYNPAPMDFLSSRAVYQDSSMPSVKGVTSNVEWQRSSTAPLRRPSARSLSASLPSTPPNEPVERETLPPHLKPLRCVPGVSSNFADLRNGEATGGFRAMHNMTSDGGTEQYISRHSSILALRRSREALLEAARQASGEPLPTPATRAMSDCKSEQYGRGTYSMMRPPVYDGSRRGGYKQSADGSLGNASNNRVVLEAASDDDSDPMLSQSSPLPPPTLPPSRLPRSHPSTTRVVRTQRKPHENNDWQSVAQSADSSEDSKTDTGVKQKSAAQLWQERKAGLRIQSKRSSFSFNV